MLRGRGAGAIRAANSPAVERVRGRVAVRGIEPVRHVDRHQLAGVGVEQQRRQVGGELRVVADAVGERLDDPVDLVEQDGGVGGAQPAVARGGAGDERVDVRREARDPARRAAGTSSWTCL